MIEELTEEAAVDKLQRIRNAIESPVDAIIKVSLIEKVLDD